MPPPAEVLIEAEHDLRASVQRRLEIAATQMVRGSLLTTPAQTPAELLTDLFPGTSAVTIDIVVRMLMWAIQIDDITVGAQRRLTWVGP